jgi:protein-L-isoaspartate(D-aspartate) O-methyltransferase
MPGRRVIYIGIALAVIATLGAVVAITVLSEGSGMLPGIGATPPDDDTLADRRSRLVRGLRASHDLTSSSVLEAMEKTPRHRFVPPRLREMAYEDRPLPIGSGQTISAPGVVAMMTQLLDVSKDETVLEVGTGCGYQAAVLADIAQHVYTIEIVPELAESAEATLNELGYDNVTVRCGDGYAGWPEQAPFDGIIVTCAPEAVPQPLCDQLAEGGRLVIPVGPQRATQWLYLLEKKGDQLIETRSVPVQFVPMTGRAEDVQ